MAGKTQTAVEVPPIKIQRMKLSLVGDSPLICHAWDEKAKRMMLDKQMGVPTERKEPKDPWADFCNSLYWMSPKPENPTEDDIQQARFGLPSVSFKNAAVGACSFVGGIFKTEARGILHIDNSMVEIMGSKPRMREDMVRLSGRAGVADIRYRGEFDPWWVTLSVSFNENVASTAQIVHLFNQAGFAVGVAEWRPQKNGDYGRFHVAQEGEVPA